MLLPYSYLTDMETDDGSLACIVRFYFLVISLHALSFGISSGLLADSQ
jgi:hypothetical protein